MCTGSSAFADDDSRSKISAFCVVSTRKLANAPPPGCFNFFAPGPSSLLPSANARGAERRKAHLCHALRSARRATLVRRDASLATADKFTQSAQTSCEGCSPHGIEIEFVCGQNPATWIINRDGE